MKESLLHFLHPKGKKWQAYYIAPLNHLLLLPSGPGRVQQELVV